MSNQDPKPFEAQNRALTILVAGIRLAQSKGAFTLEESTELLQAIKVFEPATQPAQAAPQVEGAPVGTA